MTTESTASLVKQLVAFLLDAVPVTGGNTLRELVAARVYVNRPPDAAQYPYVVVRLYGMRNDPSFDNARMVCTLECTTFARPRSSMETAEQIGDRIMQACAAYRSATQGIVFCTGIQRDTLPAFHEPSDSDVTAVRVAASLALWPALLLGS